VKVIALLYAKFMRSENPRSVKVPAHMRNVMRRSHRVCWHGINGALSLINDHAGATALHMAHITLQCIVHRNAGASSRLAVVGSEVCRLLDGTAQNLSPIPFSIEQGERGVCAKNHCFWRLTHWIAFSQRQKQYVRPCLDVYKTLWSENPVYLFG
jgi:hypothetical protein